MKFNLWKTDFLVNIHGGYEYRYVITTKEPTREVLEALIPDEDEYLDEVYTSEPCIGVGMHGELLWGEADA